MSPDHDLPGRHETGIWLLLTVLWRFGTGRPLFTVDSWWFTQRQRAAYRWTLVALAAGMLLNPSLTIAVACAAGGGFAAGAIWARRSNRPEPWAPPATVDHRASPGRPVSVDKSGRPRLDSGLASVVPLWRPDRRDI
jgi:hypothetical protein